MAHQNVEIEIKHPLFNPEEVKKYLNENAETVSQNILQKDTYFIPSHRDFLKLPYPFEWLRVRESEKGMSVNYKHFYPENVAKTDYCDEYESKIENAEALKKIFKSLDIREAVVVEKVRSTWMLDKVEIVIDEVTNLGCYIELEATENFPDPTQGKHHLYEMSARVKAQVGPEDFRGYPFLILEKQGYKFGV